MKNKLMRNAVNNSYFLNSKKNEEKRDVRCKLNGTSISKDDIFFFKFNNKSNSDLV